jgi:hypothetical protein
MQFRPQMLPLYIWYGSFSKVAILWLGQLALKCSRSASGAGPSKVAILQLEQPHSQRLLPYGWCCSLSKVTILQLVTALSSVTVLHLVQRPSQRSTPYSWYDLTLKRCGDTVGTSGHNCIKSAGCDVKSTAICMYVWNEHK